MRLLIVTGGTGGHIYPALALANAAKQRDPSTEILFVGNEDRMESTLIPEQGFSFLGLRTSGLSGSILKKGKAVVQMLIAYKKARKIIQEFSPDVAIGFGGYVSAPVMLAAHSYRIPCFIHEQNSIMGTANRFLSKKMSGIIVCYQKVYDELQLPQVKLLGNPRASIAAKHTFNDAYFKSLQLTTNKPIILIVMGSLGSTSVNAIMKEVLTQIDKHYQIIYVTGKQNYDSFQKRFQNLPNIKIMEYVDQMAILDKVDLIICRGGATTAAEITAKGIASIIVPSPYVANNHQYYNAKCLEEAGCAKVIPEQNLNAKTLNVEIDKILNNSKVLKTMKENAKKISYPNACENILNWIDEVRRG